MAGAVAHWLKVSMAVWLPPKSNPIGDAFAVKAVESGYSVSKEVVASHRAERADRPHVTD